MKNAAPSGFSAAHLNGGNLRKFIRLGLTHWIELVFLLYPTRVPMSETHRSCQSTKFGRARSRVVSVADDDAVLDNASSDGGFRLPPSFSRRSKRRASTSFMQDSGALRSAQLRSGRPLGSRHHAARMNQRADTAGRGLIRRATARARPASRQTHRCATTACDALASGESAL